MSATRSLGRLRALTPVERRVLGEALFLLPFACIGLRITGLRRTEAMLARVVRGGLSHEGVDAHVVARLVSVAARHGPVRAKCLSASITLKSLLRRYGMQGDLRLGVCKREGRLEAHAWIELAGVPLLEPGVRSRFAPFESGARGL